MFIQTEPTPNPASLKFLPGCNVLPGGSADFVSQDEASNSPLAQALFGIDGVSGVFLGQDFITISKSDAQDWPSLKPLVLGAIMQHFTSGQPVMLEQSGDGSAAQTDGADDNEVVRQIKDLLDQRVRPVVARDGGDIVYRDFQEGVVYLHMRGSCAGCPSSTATLKHGIENMLRHFVPEVQAVEAVN